MRRKLFEPTRAGADDYETLAIERRGAVDWVTLNRPDSLNAMNRTMMLELQHYFGDLYTDHDVRVVVIRGAGRAFSAGLDLKERREEGEGGPVNGLRVQRRVSEIVMRMRRAPQPIVSLLHGPASGGGFALALATDIRLASPGARMNAAFIRIGLTACDVGASYFLPRLVGSSLASELLLTGDFIDADRALRVGLVSDVVPEDALEARAQRTIDAMLANSPVGVRLTKECLNMSVDASSLEAVIAMEDRQQILCAQTRDMREGVSAFLGKRAPEYKDG